MGLEQRAFNLHRSIEETLDLLAPKAAEKSIELCYYATPETPDQLVGDAMRLRQILVNLLSNAIKFTSRGEVYVAWIANGLRTVGYACILPFKTRALVLRAQHLPHLFQPFSQVDSSNTRRYGGTGLGLAISKRLVELMGGEIWAESVEGEGSTFHFTILAGVAQSSVHLPYRNPAPSILAKHVALVVDDNPRSRELLRRHLEYWGMSVTTVADPVQADAWLERHSRCDLAVIDQQMPDLSGLDYAASLRQQRPTLPIILMRMVDSGFSRNGDNPLDPVTTLTKPVKPHELFTAVTTLLTPMTSKPQPPTVTPNSAVDTGLGDRHPLRILLAEDNIVNQKVALRLLQRLGYDADVAKNGAEAVRLNEQGVYDILLMDIQMPEMDGLEATRRIRAAVDQHQPHIIAMTAAAMQVDRDQCIEAGMDDFLPKPTRLEDVQAAIQRYLTVLTD